MINKKSLTCIKRCITLLPLQTTRTIPAFLVCIRPFYMRFLCIIDHSLVSTTDIDFLHGPLYEFLFTSVNIRYCDLNKAFWPKGRASTIKANKNIALATLYLRQA